MFALDERPESLSNQDLVQLRRQVVGEVLPVTLFDRCGHASEKVGQCFKHNPQGITLGASTLHNATHLQGCQKGRFNEIAEDIVLACSRRTLTVRRISWPLQILPSKMMCEVGNVKVQ